MQGADITQELSNAVIANDQERIKFLVGKGADVNKPDSQGYTPLTNAARQRQDTTVKLLIGLKADPNLADGNGMTPLITAAMRDACADGQGAARQAAPISRNRGLKDSVRSRSPSPRANTRRPRR